MKFIDLDLICTDNSWRRHGQTTRSRWGCTIAVTAYSIAFARRQCDAVVTTLANSTRGGATFVSASERARALRRGAVGEGLGLNVAGRAALDRVVADLRCRVERLV